jgi:hypothetical protein
MEHSKRGSFADNITRERERCGIPPVKLVLVGSPLSTYSTSFEAQAGLCTGFLRGTGKLSFLAYQFTFLPTGYLLVLFTVI